MADDRLLRGRSESTAVPDCALLYRSRKLSRSDQIRRQLGQPVVLVLCEAIDDRHVLAFDVARLLQALMECAQTLRDIVGRSQIEKSDHRQRRLLRARRQRPRRRAAEDRDKLAAFHSITSSARASTAAGISRPSAFAVLRLITSSYFVGA